MESAIDKHLKCPRTLSRRVHETYQPPFPMWVARAEESMKQVVMAYLGIQFKSAENRNKALDAMNKIISFFSETDGPLSYDLTHHEDRHGFDNFMIVGYWRDPASYCRWLNSQLVKNWWESEDRLNDGIGYFREIIAPRAEQFETLYSYKDDLPGVGGIMDGISGEVEEHGYWGSMRDRFPISQTDWMIADDDLKVVSGDPFKGGRVVIKGHDNIALIRSGQDWGDAEQDERSLYLNEILPTLTAGMDFLTNEGLPLGCYSNRFVRNIDRDGNLLDLSYNIGHWRSLDRLERWAESHPTHLRIFTTFFKVAAGLSKLRLYHEVSVSDSENQSFEYINCHPKTGMLAVVTAS